MKSLLIIGLLAISTFAQTKNPELAEIVRLRDELVRSTKEYAALLEKQIPSQERNVQRAEDRLKQLQGLREQSLVSEKEVEDAGRSLKAAQNKVAEIRRGIADAAKQIEQMPTDAELEREYKQAVKKRAATKRRACRNWTLTAYQRQQGRKTISGFQVVCER